MATGWALCSQLCLTAVSHAPKHCLLADLSFLGSFMVAIDTGHALFLSQRQGRVSANGVSHSVAASRYSDLCK
jgi:hypothetical protein